MSESDLKATVTADTTDFNKKMGQLGVTANSAAKSVAAALTAATAATAALGVQAIKTGAEYQMLEKRLQGVFGKEHRSKSPLTGCIFSATFLQKVIS